MLSIVTMPLIANWAIATFAKTGRVVPLQFGKVAEVVGIALIPVAIGMVSAAKPPEFARRIEKSFKLFSALVLAVFALIAIATEWVALTHSFASLGPAVVLFNVLSLSAGYFVSRAAGMDKALSIAISFEIGIHNAGYLRCAERAWQPAAGRAARTARSVAEPRFLAFRGGCVRTSPMVEPLKVRRRPATRGLRLCNLMTATPRTLCTRTLSTALRAAR